MSKPKKKKSIFDVFLKDTEETKQTNDKKGEPKKPGGLEHAKSIAEKYRLKLDQALPGLGTLAVIGLSNSKVMKIMV